MQTVNRQSADEHTYADSDCLAPVPARFGAEFPHQPAHLTGCLGAAQHPGDRLMRADPRFRA